MQATVNAKELKAAVTFVSKVIRKPVLPILHCVLLSAEDGKLTVRATNLDIDLARTVKADVQETGQLTVDAKALKGYLGKVKGKGAVVSIESKPNLWATYTANGISVTLSALPTDDYPLSLTDVDWDHALGFGPDNLKQIAKFADHEDRTRIVLKCVLVEVYNGEDYRYRLTTADGYRLASTNAIEGEAVASYLLPVQAAEIIAGLKSTGVLKFGSHKYTNESLVGYAEFATGDSTVRSRLEEGKFPDYSQIIPASDKGTWVTFDTAALTEKLESLAAIADKYSHLVRIELHYDLAMLSVTDNDGNEGSAVLSLDWTGEEGFAIAFNAKYLSLIHI